MTKNRVASASYGVSVKPLSVTKGLILGSYMAATLLLPATLLAEVKFNPRATVGYANNSNVFDLDESSPTHVGNSGPSRSDSVLSYLAGFDSQYLFGRQLFFVNAQGTRTDYHQFDELSHNEYLIDSGLQWKLFTELDGKLGYHQEHRMVPFTDLDPLTNASSVELLLETERDYSAALNLNVTPDWRVETSWLRRSLDSPRPPAATNLGLTENTYIEGLKYIGLAKLSVGVEAQQINGHFIDTGTLTTNLGANEDYTQSTLRFAAAYKVTDLTTLNLEAGHTKRHQPGAEDVSAFTGLLGYTRALTAKTSINLQFIRSVDSYLSNANSEINTGERIGVTWQPTFKTSFAATQEWRRSEFPGQFAAGSSESRIDRHRITTVDAHYAALRWLSVHPYWRYESRDSNIQFFSFTGTVVGIELQLQKAQ